jgi:hypothetical protein
MLVSLDAAAFSPQRRAAFDARRKSFDRQALSTREKSGRGVPAAAVFLASNHFTRKTKGLAVRPPSVAVLQTSVSLKDTSMAVVRSRGGCSPLVRGILQYVVKHPDAKDTLDGINEFWLSGGRVDHGKSEVRDALEFLSETKHWLVKSKAGAAVTLYALNKPRLAEIQEFLQRAAENN